MNYFCKKKLKNIFIVEIGSVEGKMGDNWTASVSKKKVMNLVITTT